MKGQSFDKYSLSRAIKKSDFYKYDQLSDDAYLEKEVLDAYDVAHKLLPPAISETISNGKTVYYVNDLPWKLVLRRLHSNVCNNIEVEKCHRTEIVRNIISYVQEGVKSKIFLIDIKSFYESIDIDVLLKRINHDHSLSCHSKNLIRLILNEHIQNGNSGLPRGIELSSILSDIYMQEFDIIIKEMNEVFLY
ncbi:reverse transcriptase, partial [Escherichia coli]|nr:reverse transcriptase [Escherichia coli]